jgi:uncharacterized protein (DUF1501 family)
MKPVACDRRPTRRDFLRQSSCAALGVTGLVNALAQMRLMTAALAQDSTTTGYKALVCLFLHGGHDANNLLVPAGERGADPLREDYENGRGVLALPAESLLPLTLPATSAAFSRHHGDLHPPMGLHPAAGSIATLFNAGKLAFICNVGTLAYPIPTRLDFINRLVPRPRQLFSHEDQQVQWQSSVADRPFGSGWGGRAADLLHASYNSPSTSRISMSISMAGINSFQVGTAGDLFQYVVKPTGTLSLSGFDASVENENPYDAALHPDGSYQTTDAGKRLKGFEDIMRLTHDNLHEEAYNRVITRARSAEGYLGAALTAAGASGIDFDALFAGAATPLGDQLKAVAKLISSRAILGNNRQIFFCQVGGYDNHQSLLSAHPNLLTELSGAMQAFHDALQALGAWNDVTTFTASDFNRTFSPNSLDPFKAGSDHGWGSHAMVMGGAIRGGDLYGHFPPLKTGAAPGSIDTNSARGQWIPDISVDQYSAVLARWMGAGSSELETIFPNLTRFDDPLTVASANLGFL